MGYGIVTWITKKQITTTLSLMEMEYKVTRIAACEDFFIKE